MGTGFSIPASTEEVIRLKPIEGDVCTDLCIFQRTGPFFAGGYPRQKSLSSRLSLNEWNMLQKEFTDVWNEEKYSKCNPACVTCAIFPGAYLLCIPLCLVTSKYEKRDQAMHEVVAKVNKYILRPRGMFMKRFMVVEGGGESQKEIKWYEIGLTEQEITRMENKLTYDGSSCNCCGGKGPNDYITEDTVKADVAFQSRWPVPNLILATACPEGVAPSLAEQLATDMPVPQPMSIER